MELLDRYLQAVRKYLPKRRQDDIVEELSVEIQAQMEEMEAGLGRTLTEEERVALIKHYGHPMVVAARYMPQKHLVGPGLFPYYWFTLTRALGLAAVVYVIVNACMFAFGHGTIGDAFRQIAQFPNVALQTAAWITLAFAFIEWGARGLDVKANFFDNWDPRSLPALQKETERRRRWNEITDLIFHVIALLWLLALPRYFFQMLGPGAVYVRALPVQPAPGWHVLYWILVTSLALQVVYKIVALGRQPSARRRIAMNLVFKSVGLVVLALLLKAQTVVVPTANFARVPVDLAQINYGLHISFQIVAFIVVLDFAWEAWKLAVAMFRGEQIRPTSASCLGVWLW